MERARENSKFCQIFGQSAYTRPHCSASDATLDVLVLPYKHFTLRHVVIYVDILQTLSTCSIVFVWT